MTCLHCKESAGFKGYRPKSPVSLLGTLRIWRGYYHCEHCHHGHFPWDEILRLSPQGLTPGAQEVVALGGTQEAFGKAAEWTLQKMAGIRLSESTVQRTTEAAGERLAQQLQEGKVFGSKTVWDWHRDASGKTCAYLSVDATGIMMQGPGAAKTEGRMASVGMIYNPQPRQPEDEELSKPCDGVRYLAGLYTLDELGLQMRRQAAHVGVGAAERWIALTDGGNGLEDWIEVNFPLAVKILDFRHASEYLADFAKKYRPGEEAEGLLATWCHRMKHEGGSAILQELEALNLRKMTKEARAEHARAANYIRNNVARMNYPEYLRQGWQIATGAVESACKTVVNQRLCLGGMRWGEGGSDAVCHLRALYRSDPDQWDAFWGYYAMAA
jgi:hypothetical protein